MNNKAFLLTSQRCHVTVQAILHSTRPTPQMGRGNLLWGGSFRKRYLFQAPACLFVGQVSIQRAILRVREFRSRAKDSVEAFVEEAVIRRELADNFCFYNQENYDSIKGAYEWAQKTLQDHAQDKREYLYTREQMEQGSSHDDLWNAAQVLLHSLVSQRSQPMSSGKIMIREDLFPNQIKF